jgi:hypothetical protein
MASKHSIAASALIVSAIIGVGAHQARAGVLDLNIRLLVPWAKFTSAADPKCARLWVTHARNDPALRCYLTTDIARLCDPDERLHLASTLRRYRWDATMLWANTIIAAVRPLTMPVATPQQLQQAHQELSAQIDGHSQPNREMSALRAITEKRIDNILNSRPATLDAALEVELLPHNELLSPLRAIAIAGFMRKGEFGWAAGGLVDEAFESIASGQVCKDRTSAGEM